MGINLESLQSVTFSIGILYLIALTRTLLTPYNVIKSMTRTTNYNNNVICVLPRSRQQQQQHETKSEVMC